jgi:hypothetical protein
MATEVDLNQVPPIVRQQQEAAAKLIAEKPPEETKPEPTAEEIAATEAAKTPEGEGKELELPAGEKAKEPATFSEGATDEMSKEQRYKVLEGMHRRAEREAGTLRSELAALREHVQSLETKLATAPPLVATPIAAPDGEAKGRLLESFGAQNTADLVAMLRAEGFVVTKDLEPVREGVERVTKTIATTAQSEFYTTLQGLVPDYEAKNADPKFGEFLDSEEGHTGQTRREIAKRHIANGDPHRLAAIFIAFDQAPAAPVKPGLDKKKFAAPPATAAAAAVIKEDEGPVKVKTSEFTRFAADVRAGKFTGATPEDHVVKQKAMNVERERLETARREGRVVEG